VLAGIDVYYMGTLASQINNAFAKVYVSLDKVNATGKPTLKYSDNLDDNGFLLLLYHYTAPHLLTQFPVKRFAVTPWASARDALEFFRGAILEQITTNGVRNALLLVQEILNDVNDVAEALERLASKSNAASSTELYKLFAFLGLSSWLVPLLVGAELYNYLTKALLQEIEATDIRVFKIGGLQRIAPLYNAINPLLRTGQASNIIAQLRAYRTLWVSDVNGAS
jgi:hypothetical protein